MELNECKTFTVVAFTHGVFIISFVKKGNKRQHYKEKILYCP